MLCIKKGRPNPGAPPRPGFGPLKVPFSAISWPWTGIRSLIALRETPNVFAELANLMAQGRVEEKRDPNVEKSHRNKNNVDHVVGIHSLNSLRGIVVPELACPTPDGCDRRVSSPAGAADVARVPTVAVLLTR